VDFGLFGPRISILFSLSQKASQDLMNVPAAPHGVPDQESRRSFRLADGTMQKLGDLPKVTTQEAILSSALYEVKMITNQRQV
jgi:hypothetical protein